jgi:RimJ/RimL family protein N-acetyltransferase
MFGPTIEAGKDHQGEPVTLDQPKPEYFDTFVPWLNDPEVMQHLNPAWEVVSRINEEINYTESKLSLDDINWTILLDNRPVGAAWLNEIDHVNKSASLGVMIGDKNCWKKGLGTLVCKAVINHGFIDSGIEIIHIAFTEENRGSHAIAEKLGFNLLQGRANFTDGLDYPGWDGTLTKDQWRKL